MTPAEAKLRLSRRDRTVRAIARSWRELTGGTGRDLDHARRTLIACSGGADSSGLVLALAAAVSNPADIFVIAHIVHDMRSREQSLADRDAAKALAERLGILFVEGEAILQGSKGNAEAAARKLRYAALERLAVQARCPYIAIAHHAGDQLETVLMALVRGAGPRGLSGIPRSRKSGAVQIIRPALGVTRDALQSLCTTAGWTWREDATNQDESKLRAAIRHRIIPELERLRPGASIRAGRSATLIQGAAALVHNRVKELRTTGHHWKRTDLRQEPAVVLGDLIKTAAAQLTAGRGQDRLTATAIGKVVRAIRDSSTEPRQFTIGGVIIKVTSREVRIGVNKSE